MEPKGPAWVVTLLAGVDDAPVPVLEGTFLTLTFDEAEVSGSAGCNTYSGPATFDDTVRIGPVAVTMMYCPEPHGVMEQEGRFLDLLRRVDSWGTDGEHLELRCDGVTTVVLSPLLVGLTGSWSLLSYGNGKQGLVDLIPETEITAIFETGRLRGHGGCNRYTTTYATEGAALTIGPPAGTRMICQEPPGMMEQEATYLGLLPNAHSFLIRNGRFLDIHDREGTRLLQYVRT
jgi:heat shock protein HslJ